VVVDLSLRHVACDSVCVCVGQTLKAHTLPHSPSPGQAQFLTMLLLDRLVQLRNSSGLMGAHSVRIGSEGGLQVFLRFETRPVTSGSELRDMLEDYGLEEEDEEEAGSDWLYPPYDYNPPDDYDDEEAFDSDHEGYDAGPTLNKALLPIGGCACAHPSSPRRMIARLNAAWDSSSVSSTSEQEWSAPEEESRHRPAPPRARAPGLRRADGTRAPPVRSEPPMTRSRSAARATPGGSQVGEAMRCDAVRSAPVLCLADSGYRCLFALDACSLCAALWSSEPLASVSAQTCW
jgi:hypothetical protein